MIEDVIKKVNKKFGETIITKGAFNRVNDNVIPTSSPYLNYCLYGGLPRGRLIELAGEPSAGKSTTCLDIVHNAQKLFKQEFLDLEKRLNDTNLSKDEKSKIDLLYKRGEQKIVYADCENTYDSKWADVFGVDTDSLIVLQPTNQGAEDIFQSLLDLVDTGEVGLVILDSIGVLVSNQAMEKTVEERTYGGIAMALTQFSKKMEMMCKKYNCTFIGINQIREDLSSTYSKFTTTGGLAWKHNCTLRLFFMKGSFIDENGQDLKRSAVSPAGHIVHFSIEKTKCFPNNRRNGFYSLYYTIGIDFVTDLIQLCLLTNILIQSGAWYEFDKEQVDINERFQGKLSIKKLLLEDTTIQEKVKNALDKVIKN